MATANMHRRDPDEVTRLGEEILRRKVEPLLSPADAGKFVAIALDNGDFEVHRHDVTAMKLLIARQPDGDLWLGRAFEEATYKIGRG